MLRSIVDYNHDAGIDLSARLRPWLGLGMTLRASASLMPKTREVDTRRYYFNDKGPRARDEAVRAMPHKEAFAPELIAPDGWQPEELTRPTDNYTATHRAPAIPAHPESPATTESPAPPESPVTTESPATQASTASTSSDAQHRPEPTPKHRSKHSRNGTLVGSLAQKGAPY